MANPPKLSSKSFFEKLESQWEKNNSLVCIGLDSDYSKIPETVKRECNTISECLQQFNFKIIDATADLVCAYKPNIAFYEDLGIEGLSALIQTVEYIHKKFPELPVILDAKRGDIGSTNKGYVNAIFNVIKADAITVHPYLGKESLQVFLEQKKKGIFVLCKTSNPGAGEFQDLRLVNNDKKIHLYQFIAIQVATSWNKERNCGLVMGATYPTEIGEVRNLVGDIPFLVPGIGAQSGDLEMTVRFGLDSRNKGLIINSARKIIFASSGSDFAEAARDEARKLRDNINRYR
jgi:orotidine-5'-phosphate decarboxylase